MLFMNNQSLTQEFPLDKLNFIQTQILDGREPLTRWPIKRGIDILFKLRLYFLNTKT